MFLKAFALLAYLALLNLMCVLGLLAFSFSKDTVDPEDPDGHWLDSGIKVNVT